LSNFVRSGARQQNNSKRLAGPQPEHSFAISTKLGDANRDSGNVRGSYNTAIAYDMDAVAGGARAQRDNFGRLASFPPSISTSVGNYNSGSGNIVDSGGVAISYRGRTAAASTWHAGEERRTPTFN